MPSVKRALPAETRGAEEGHCGAPPAAKPDPAQPPPGCANGRQLEEICEEVVALLAPALDLAAVERLALVPGAPDAADDGPAVDRSEPVAPACVLCGNADEALFVVDHASGDTICTGPRGEGCGNVVEARRLVETSAHRHFEGEEDKSHHGPAPNRLYSSSMNLRTSISKLGDNAQELRRLAEDVEMNLSQMGKDDRRTRAGYKDAQKREAFERMQHAAASLGLHAAVLARAQALFARLRDAREHVHAFEAVIAACLVRALQTAAAPEAPPRPPRAAQAKRRRVSRAHASATRGAPTLYPFACGGCGARFASKRCRLGHSC